MQLKKFDSAGVAHVILLLVIVVGVAIIGVYLLLASHGLDLQTANTLAADKAVQARERLQTLPDYAGISLTDDGKINIYSKNPSAAFRSQAVGDNNGSDFVFHQTQHTAQEYDQVQASIVQDTGFLHSQGVKLVSAAANPETDSVDLTIESPTDSVLKLITQKYGEIVKVKSGERIRRLTANHLSHFAATLDPGGSTTITSRLTDSAPWNGGDVIATHSGTCSSGLAIKNSAGTTMVMTAGHCFMDPGSASTLSSYKYLVYQKNDSSPYGTNTSLMGYAAAKNTIKGFDVALINARAYGRIWTTEKLTDQSSTAKQKQIGAAYSVKGELVCVSGAFSGQNCSGKVGMVDGTIWECRDDSCYYSDPYPHMSIATNIYGSVMAGPGDSGAPVYAKRTTGFLVKGLLIAGKPGLPCQYYNTGDRYNNCAATVYYHEIAPLLQNLNAKIYVP
ncbi:MAG TPA: hypothetical protein VLG37_01295 [Candidatus Saccharimonadales bacterium]|nr:hypothetical protein [Candidatus Saccharimonadales bacterium]